MIKQILPPSIIGIIGGGQLGMMTIREAQRMGYGSIVWDPDPDCPAARLADETVTAPFSDQNAARRVVESANVVTFEFEHIDSSVVRWIEDHSNVFPSSNILRISQHRRIEKDELSKRGFPVVNYRVAASSDELKNAFAALGFPIVVKTATAGYDGKGQHVIPNQAQAGGFLENLSEDFREVIVESFVDLQTELSVIAVRGSNGIIRTFPVAENEHRENILYKSTIPARVTHSIKNAAVELASDLIEQLEVIGILCVEMFVTKEGRVLVNELAPRPHNSGHYSLDACDISQFEALVRSICHLPLPAPELLSPCAMINILGRDLEVLDHSEVLNLPGTKIHLYGKKRVEPKRKMGHITILGPSSEEVGRRVSVIEKHFARKSGSTIKASALAS